MRAFLIGAAIGYVFGARAGRERYEQIVRLYRTIVDHPAVQGTAGVVRAKVGEWTGHPVDQPDSHAPNGRG
jgi:hypothetical protein